MEKNVRTVSKSKQKIIEPDTNSILQSNRYMTTYSPDLAHVL